MLDKFIKISLVTFYSVMTFLIVVSLSKMQDNTEKIVEPSETLILVSDGKIEIINAKVDSIYKLL